MAIKKMGPGDPKKKTAVIGKKKGDMALGSDKLNQTLADGQARAAAAKKNGTDMEYLSIQRGDTRFGGSNLGAKDGIVEKDGQVAGGSRAQMKASRRRVRANSASPQAKKSAIKLYR